jgi:hypothetical protein
MSLRDRYEPRRSIESKLFKREMGRALALLGPVQALVGLVYLLSFLGD